MKNYDLIIIGGGSAGLASAISASNQRPCKILIIDRGKDLGGILLQCIHNGFGLIRYKEELTGPEYAQRLYSELISHNIEFKVNTIVIKITKDKHLHLTSMKGYEVVAAKAIIIAAGCYERTAGQIGLPGSRPSGVLTAGLGQHYLNIEGYKIGKKAFILGSGDIGLIMARRLTLEGTKVEGVAEIMPYSNGLKRNIVQCLDDFNIPLYLSHTVTKVIGKNRLEKIIVSKVDKNFNPIPGADKEIEVDLLLLSVGLIPDNSLLEKLGVMIDPKTKGPIVDEEMQTSIDGIFACGNSLHVHDLADNASIEGEVAGKAAIKYIYSSLSYKNKIKTTAGKGISYILPQNLYLDNPASVNLAFRVNKPFDNKYIIIKQNNKIIKKIKKQFLLPAKMENIKLNKNDLINDNLVMEVE